MMVLLGHTLFILKLLYTSHCLITLCPSSNRLATLTLYYWEVNLLAYVVFAGFQSQCVNNEWE